MSLTLIHSHERLFRIFIIKGLVTIAVSTVALFVVPAWSQKVKWVMREYLFFTLTVMAGATDCLSWPMQSVLVF